MLLGLLWPTLLLHSAILESGWLLYCALRWGHVARIPFHWWGFITVALSNSWWTALLYPSYWTSYPEGPNCWVAASFASPNCCCTQHFEVWADSAPCLLRKCFLVHPRQSYTHPQCLSWSGILSPRESMFWPSQAGAPPKAELMEHSTEQGKRELAKLGYLTLQTKQL